MVGDDKDAVFRQSVNELLGIRISLLNGYIEFRAHFLLDDTGQWRYAVGRLPNNCAGRIETKKRGIDG